MSEVAGDRLVQSQGRAFVGRDRGSLPTRMLLTREGRASSLRARAAGPHLQAPPQQLTTVPHRHLWPPSLFTETSFIRGFHNCQTQGTVLGPPYLTSLGHVGHPALGALSSQGCPGPQCPPPPTTAATASQLPSLPLFLQFPLKCRHYPGALVSSSCYNEVL